MLSMGKSTISTRPFSSSQTVCLNQSKYLDQWYWPQVATSEWWKQLAMMKFCFQSLDCFFRIILQFCRFYLGNFPWFPVSIFPQPTKNGDWHKAHQLAFSHFPQKITQSNRSAPYWLARCWLARQRQRQRQHQRQRLRRCRQRPRHRLHQQ